jgi:hypothetical protein
VHRLPAGEHHGDREDAADQQRRTPTRQVAFFAKEQPSPLPFTERMKRAIDSARGRRLYARRIATVEPVFANLRRNERLVAKRRTAPTR